MDRDDYITYDGRCLIDQSYQSQFDKEEYPLPTDTDWEMIRQWHCDADTRSTSKHDISTKQPLISTRQPNIPVWPWNWWDCAYTDYADPVLCDLGRIWNWCESNEYIRRECAATCNC